MKEEKKSAKSHPHLLKWKTISYLFANVLHELHNLFSQAILRTGDLC